MFIKQRLGFEDTALALSPGTEPSQFAQLGPDHRLGNIREPALLAE